MASFTFHLSINLLTLLYFSYVVIIYKKEKDKQKEKVKQEE